MTDAPLANAPLVTVSPQAGRSVERLRELRETFAEVGPPGSRRGLAALVRAALVIYWLACAGVIGVGLDRMHPEWREALARTAGLGT